MNKVKSLIFLISAILITLLMTVCSVPQGGSSGGGGGGENIPNPVQRTIPANWTILIHFAIDNNIDYTFEKDNGIVSNYLSTLESIKALDVGDNIEILVLMDCYNRDTRFKDGYYRLTGGSFSGDRLTPIKTEVNSGSLDETKSFMDWAVKYYPANNYMYSVFNHGSGFDDRTTSGTYSTYGIGFDDTDFDCLTHYELGQATSYLKVLTGKNLDIFYAYACLMGGVELAYEIRNNADYLLFSEQIFPADYWSYEALGSINSNPSISTENLGKAFCDSAYTYFSSLATPRDFTLSLIDLSKIDDLYNAIDTYASSAISNIGSNSTTASYYNTAANNSFKMDTSYYVDLGNYMNHANSSSGIDASVKTNILAVQTAISNAVVYQRQYDYPYASGISIFHNIWGWGSSYIYYSTATYKTILTFGAGNSWSDYMQILDSLDTSTVKPDQYEADNGQNQSNEIIINAAAQNHSIPVGNTAGDWDFLRVNLQAGQTYTIETHQHPTEANTVDTIIYLCDTALNLIDYDDNDAGSGYSKIIYTCTQTAKYYIAIRGYNSGSTGYYSIDVKLGSYGLSSKDNTSTIGVKKDKINKDEIEKLLKSFK